MLSVRTVAPDDPELHLWCGLFSAEHARDTGDRVDAGRLLATIRSAPAATEVGRWTAWADDEPLGVAQLAPGRTADFVRLYVLEGHRRRGAGTALFRAVRQVVPVRAVRGVVTLGEDGEHFAAARRCRTLLQLAVMTGRVDRPPPAPRLDGSYRLERWTGGVPAHLLDTYAAAKRSVGDAPGAQWQVDPDWTPARVRAWETALVAQHRTLFGIAVLAGADVVAFSEISAGDGDVATQHDTAVLPAHRRRGLATVLKAGLLDEVRRARPDVAAVTTTVNGANEPMIAVNLRLGYTVTRHRLLVEA